MAWAAVVLVAVSLIVVVSVAPEGLRLSSDPGAPVIPHWAYLLPVIVGIGLARLLPLRAPVLPPIVHDGRAVLGALLIMVVCAAAFPVIVGALGVDGTPLYHLVKVAVLIAVPAGAVWWTRGALKIPKPSMPWQWWAPGVVVTGWALLAVVAPWNEAPDYSNYPLELVIGAAVLTALTAGVGEEIFYRYWLQTRAEAVLGRWGGIAVATLLFALMHVGARQDLGLGVELAAAIVVQGTFGLFLAYVWARYRNIWLAIGAHIVANGYGVFVLSLIHI